MVALGLLVFAAGIFGIMFAQLTTPVRRSHGLLTAATLVVWVVIAAIGVRLVVYRVH